MTIIDDHSQLVLRNGAVIPNLTPGTESFLPDPATLMTEQQREQMVDIYRRSAAAINIALPVLTEAQEFAATLSNLVYDQEPDGLSFDQSDAWGEFASAATIGPLYWLLERFTDLVSPVFLGSSSAEKLEVVQGLLVDHSANKKADPEPIVEVPEIPSLFDGSLFGERHRYRAFQLAAIISNADTDLSEDILEEAFQLFISIYDRETEIVDAVNCGQEVYDYLKTISGSTVLYGALDDYVKARPAMVGGRYDLDKPQALWGTEVGQQ